MIYRLHHWPQQWPEETWEEIGAPVEASSVEEAFEIARPGAAGRYRVTLGENGEQGDVGLYLLHADKSLAELKSS